MANTDPRVAVCDGLAHLDEVFDHLCDRLIEWRVPFTRHASPQQWLANDEAVRRVEIVAGLGNMPIDEAVLARAPRLHGVVSCVSGTDGIALDAATARGVVVAHAPTDENAHGMAEATMLLLLHLHYDLDGTRDDLRLDRPRPVPVRAHMLAGRTIGLVGWGRIAQHLARLLAPWGVTLLVYSRRGQPPDLPPGAQAVGLDDLMRRSDAVCVLAGAVAGAPPIVSREQLAALRPEAFLINVSRGATLDEAALIDALRAGRLAGAALDVFAVEPLPADSPLRTLPNVILTPHHVGHTQEGDASLFRALEDNVKALLDGRIPPYVRNPAAVPGWQARQPGRGPS